MSATSPIPSSQRPHPVGAQQRADGTAPRQAPPEAVIAPVAVEEIEKQPKRKLVTTRRRDRHGNLYLEMRPAVGYRIERVAITDLDPVSRRAKISVITERRRGQPTRSQRDGDGES